MSAPRKYLHNAHVVLLSVLAFGMPNLNLLMSVATILLAAWWFVYPGPKKGLEILRSNRPALALIVLFAIHLIWLVNTEDWNGAFKDLRIKLNIFVLCVAVGGVSRNRRDILRVLFWFSAGLWVAIFTTLYNYSAHDGPVLDMREMVGDISHIRLSLMMVAAVVAAIAYGGSLSRGWKIYSYATALACAVFLNFIQSATGMVILALLLAFSGLFFLYRRFGKRYLAGSMVALSIAMLALGGLAWKDYESYFTSDERVPEETLYTYSGNAYTFIPSYQVENGRHVFYYLSKGEVYEAWNERSDVHLPPDGPDGEALEARLYRYMTAKGLNKDREGVAALSDEDVRRIESGYAAPIYAESSGVSLRWHVMLFGIHAYLNSGDASGSSLFQRVVYWNVAGKLIKENFWTGTGTGDLRREFKSAYERFDIPLDREFRHRAHNQFLTFFVTFGVWGLLAFTAVFYTFVYTGKGDYLVWCLALLLAMSCMTEDTLETQAGVTFFTAFVAMFGVDRHPRTSHPQKPL